MPFGLPIAPTGIEPGSDLNSCGIDQANIARSRAGLRNERHVILARCRIELFSHHKLLVPLDTAKYVPVPTSGINSGAFD